MTYIQLLSALIVCAYASTAISKSTPLENAEKPLTIPTEKLTKIAITKEEAFYIYSECKQFSREDKIEAEYVDDYIELCISELTQAVKKAKYQRRKNHPTIPSMKGER